MIEKKNLKIDHHLFPSLSNPSKPPQQKSIVTHGSFQYARYPLVLISLLLIPTRGEIPSRHSCKKGGQPSWIPNVKGTASRKGKEGTWDNGLRKIPLFFPR